MVHVEPPEPEAAGSNPAGPARENVIYCRAHSVPFARADNRRCLHQGRGGRSERVGGPAFFIGTALHLLGGGGVHRVAAASRDHRAATAPVL